MSTHMRREIDEIPQAAARLLNDRALDLRAAGAALRLRDPAVVVTVARGSSDHAALFLKYAIELQAGVPVASLGPSLASIYGARLKLHAGAALAISQSGQSPDIVAMTRTTRKAGALAITLTNMPGSALSGEADQPVDIAAGPEKAVAATKSFVCSIVAGLAIVAEWTRDARLKSALDRLPDDLDKALALDWRSLDDDLAGVDSLYILGRGPSLAIAGEAALKLKETANMHAEAYSSAEVLHGPVALVEPAFPVVAFIARDAAEESVAETADRLAASGGRVHASSALAGKAKNLPFVATGHPLTDALVLIVPFYAFVEAFSRARGFDPDRPAKLKKVTETR